MSLQALKNKKIIRKEKEKTKIIGIVPFPERGGYYPTFKLAKHLQNIGYDVVYLGPPEFEKEVKSQGIKYKVLFEKEYPEGTFDPDASNEKKDFMHDKLNILKQMVNDGNAMFKAIDEGVIENILYENNIDLILVDALLPLVTLGTYNTKVKVINFATELIADSHELPPNFFTIVPKQNSLISKILIILAWFSIWINHKTQELIGNLLIVFFRLPKIPKKYKKLWKRLKKDSGLKHVFSEYIERPLLPEIVLCPEEFDFPHSSNKRCYIGHNIDLNRKEVDFPWHRLDDNKPLIYCSLGTHVVYYKDAGRFFKEIVKTAHSFPQYQFVISLGPGRSEKDLVNKPDNIIGVVRSPQLSILKKAKLMITNGGLGTVKECIMHGVPMIVLPCMFDQPGNAARVVYHGIGLMSKINKITEKSLTLLIKKIINDPAFYNNILGLKKHIEKNDSFIKGINLIKSFLN